VSSEPRVSDIIHSFPQAYQNVPSSQSSRVPQKYPVYFEAGNIEAIAAKILQTNESLKSANDTMHLAVGGPELANLEQLLKTLKETSRYHATSVSAPQVAVLLKLISSWPDDKRFPCTKFFF
jgi:phospholipase A-2-activating protein